MSCSSASVPVVAHTPVNDNAAAAEVVEVETDTATDVNTDGDNVVETVDVVIVEWNDLVQTLADKHAPHDASVAEVRLLNALERAFGAHGTGIVCLRGMPGFVPAKQAFLPLAHTLATQFTSDYLETHFVDPKSLYNAGWSHGKERLGRSSALDTSKASYYYNPVTDTPGSDQDRILYPTSYPMNRWPPPEETRLPGFREKAIALGRLLQEACVAVSYYIDKLAARQLAGYTEHLISNSVQNSDKVKARLLYYFPLPPNKEGTDNGCDDEVAEDSWIGWHNDSGFLTALAGEIYVNHETGEQIPECPDPEAGLYVMDRRGGGGAANDVANDNLANGNGGSNQTYKAVRVVIPYDCVAVQVGECTQIVTGGTVQATPHCVRGCRGKYNNIARISLPCFVDTVPSFPLSIPSSGCTREQVFAADCSNNKVPPLEFRWLHDGMTFGDFLQTTFAMYYKDCD